MNLCIFPIVENQQWNCLTTSSKLLDIPMIFQVYFPTNCTEFQLHFQYPPFSFTSTSIQNSKKQFHIESHLFIRAHTHTRRRFDWLSAWILDFLTMPSVSPSEMCSPHCRNAPVDQVEIKCKLTVAIIPRGREWSLLEAVTEHSSNHLIFLVLCTVILFALVLCENLQECWTFKFFVKFPFKNGIIEIKQNKIWRFKKSNSTSVVHYREWMDQSRSRSNNQHILEWRLCPVWKRKIALRGHRRTRSFAIPPG